MLNNLVTHSLLNQTQNAISYDINANSIMRHSLNITSLNSGDNVDGSLSYSQVAQGVQKMGSDMLSVVSGWMKTIYRYIKLEPFNEYMEKLAKTSEDRRMKIENEKRDFLREITCFNQEVNQTLHKIISEAAQEAISLSKPLLILLGEDHYSKYSGQYELEILKIALNNLNIKTILSEPFFVNDYIGSIFNIFQIDENNGPFVVVEKFANENGLIKIPIDFSACGLSDETYEISVQNACAFMSELLDKEKLRYYTQLNTADEMVAEFGMELRNEAMVEMMTKIAQLNPNENQIAIVGALHLNDIADDHSLQEHFHVLPINLSESPLLSNNSISKFIDHALSHQRKLEFQNLLFKTNLFGRSLEQFKKEREETRDEMCKHSLIEENICTKMRISI